MRRWASGSAPIPATISEALKAKCGERIAELESVIAEMGCLEETLFVRLRNGEVHANDIVTEYRRIGPRFNADTCTVGRRVTMSTDYRDEWRFTGEITSYAEIAVDRAPEGIQGVYAEDERIAVVTIRVDGQLQRPSVPSADSAEN